MPDTRTADLMAALSQRVARRVAGRGISRGAVEDAVRRVVAALPQSGGSVDRSAEVDLVATISARSTPDLASRVRSILDAEQIAIIAMGVGQAGQHTVVTLQIPAQARSAVERLAERFGYFVSFVGSADVRSA